MNEAERAKKLYAPSTTDFDFVFSRGEGSMVYDIRGKAYLDGSCMPGVFNIGYKHPRFVTAMRNAEYGPGANEYVNTVWNEVLEWLFSLTPGDFKKRGIPASSGTLANEKALKALVDTRPERKTFGVFDGAFHGRTFGSLSLNARSPVHTRGYPLPLEKVVFPFPEHKSYWHYHPERYIREVEERVLRRYDLRDMRAFFWEPVQGEGGIRVTSKPCFDLLFKILRAHDVALADDEVQAGGCRTGKFFACEHYGIVPDIVTMAKWLGSGAHIGAAIINERFCWKEPGRDSDTWSGDPYTSMAALATLRIMRGEELAKRAEELGVYLDRKLREELPFAFSKNWQWGAMLIDNLDGIGLMRRVKFVDPQDPGKPLPELRDRVADEARKRGLLLMGAGESAIRLMPPLVITKSQLDQFVKILVESIVSVIGQ